jgi:hypothetical protein
MLNVQLLRYNLTLSRLRRSGVANNVVVSSCFCGRCNLDLLVYNLVLTFRVYLCVVLVFRVFVCSCGLTLLWEVLCLAEWLFGADKK